LIPAERFENRHSRFLLGEVYRRTGRHDEARRVFQATLAEVWDGTSWSSRPTPNPKDPGTNGSVLSGVSCASATACMAVGHYYAGLAEAWNGTSWSIRTASAMASDGRDEMRRDCSPRRRLISAKNVPSCSSVISTCSLDSMCASIRVTGAKRACRRSHGEMLTVEASGIGSPSSRRRFSIRSRWRASPSAISRSASTPCA